MSNHLAIATVTSALRQRLHDVVSDDVTGIAVETLPLNDTRLRDNQPILNLFLYHVAPAPSWSNEELPVRREDGSAGTRPRLALRLHYMLTAYGRSAQTDPEAHRVLGSAVRAFHETPLLSRAEIDAVVLANSALAGSNLGAQPERIRISPQNLSVEEMAKIWSIFFQVPYRISLAYEASVVLIDGETPVRPSLPVRTRNLYVVTLRTPRLERVEASGGSHAPILPGSVIVLHGINLRNVPILVRIGGTELVPAADDVTDDRIGLTLPASLPAGVHGAQVVHPTLMGTPETEHTGVRSNLEAFVLRPAVQRNASDTAWEVSVNVTGGSGSAPRSGEIHVQVAPEVRRSQQAFLLLNRSDSSPAGSHPTAYSIAARSRLADSAETTDTLVFPFAALAAGTYLLRVQIDGAESILEASGTGLLAEPAVEVL